MTSFLSDNVLARIACTLLDHVVTSGIVCARLLFCPAHGAMAGPWNAAFTQGAAKPGTHRDVNCHVARVFVECLYLSVVFTMQFENLTGCEEDLTLLALPKHLCLDDDAASCSPAKKKLRLDSDDSDSDFGGMLDIIIQMCML